ncbi:predicted protein [Chaetoceros tenuissimus]|uniref:Uncharacterized protein n=1 Tax=Chaetoceros tenuissimus TaxID=426638 RepID=A0AAD3H8L5_9STRA|nr:predicted protein [Chaetoceros tenuissimus]
MIPSESTLPGTPVKRVASSDLYYVLSVHTNENKVSIVKKDGEVLDLSSVSLVDIPKVQLEKDLTVAFEKTIVLLGKEYHVTRSLEDSDSVIISCKGKNEGQKMSYLQFRSLEFHMNLAAAMMKFSIDRELCEKKSLKNRLKTLFGQNSGTSVLFNLSTANSSILEARCYYRRIPYLALMVKPNGHYFLGSRSYTSIPSQGCGLKVAFATVKVIVKASEATKINELEWRFGIVAGIDNSQVFLYEAIPSHGGVKGFNSLLHFQLDEVTLVGLNEVTHESVYDGFVVGSFLGPDKMSSKSVIVKAKNGKELKKDVRRLLAKAKKDCSPTTTRFRSKDLDNVQNFISKEISNGKSMKNSNVAKAGTTIVIIAGPKHLLKYNEKDSGLWCPVVREIESQNHWMQTYAKVNKNEAKSKDFTSLKSSIGEFNCFLEDHDELKLRCYDIAKYRNGLMFTYKVDERRKQMKVIKEVVCKEPMEHWEVFSRGYGVVLSHSIVDDKIYTVTEDDYTCIRNFTRGSTYGDGRDVCESTGGNFYGGCKLSARAIPKPDSSPDLNPYFQLDRQEWDSTYGPSFFKLLNRLTCQASDTMVMLNPLLDFFITKVKERAGLGQNHSDFRRHCVMSILTFGENTDGFQNSIHIDKDFLVKEFTSHAFDIMREYENTDDVTLKEELRFISSLIDLCDGCIPAPSNCGYSPVQFGKTKTDSNFHAHFLIPGLGVALRCCSNLYHFFYAAVMTHCTAIPITIQANRSVGIAVEDFNMVAWGASRCPKILEDRSFLYEPNTTTKKRKVESVNTDNCNDCNIQPVKERFDPVKSVVQDKRGILKAFCNSF